VLFAGDYIVGVGRVEVFVVLAFEDGGGQVVERDEAGDVLVLVFDEVAGEDFLAGQEEVLDFFLRVLLVELELAA